MTAEEQAGSSVSDMRLEIPKTLYKYLSPERVGNVLEGGAVRFTPLINTNDSFEIRATFRKLAGPRFDALVEEQMPIALSEESINAMIVDNLRKSGIPVSMEMAKEALSLMYGGSLKEVLQRQVLQVFGTAINHFNQPENSEALLLNAASRLYCFSLSARFDIAMMWAHYATDHTGFVVSFDANHAWFSNRRDGKSSRLRKVRYFDGTLEELLEDVEAALVSKTSDWQSEREWRLYASLDQVDRVVGTAEFPVHLMDYPANIVKQIIVGYKASAETVERIRAAHAVRYPTAELLIARPNRSTRSYDLEALGS